MGRCQQTVVQAILTGMFLQSPFPAATRISLISAVFCKGGVPSFWMKSLASVVSRCCFRSSLSEKYKDTSLIFSFAQSVTARPVLFKLLPAEPFAEGIRNMKQL